MYKKARYRGIPIFFNEENNEVKGRNWLYDLLLSINIWFDVEIVGVEGFPIYIEEK